MCSMYIICVVTNHQVYSDKCIRILPQHTQKNTKVRTSVPKVLVAGHQCSPHAFVKLRICVAQHAIVKCQFWGRVQTSLRGSNTL